MTSAGWLQGRRIAYVPYTSDLTAPGDRRRFAYWARQRDVRLEPARIGETYDLVVLSARADITAWVGAPRNGTPVVYDLIDSYLAIPRGARDLTRGVGKWLLRQHTRLVPSYTLAVERMCRQADIVVCSTPEQQAVLAAHAADVRAILDIHDEIPTAPVRPTHSPGVLRLFWEGLPENLRGFWPLFDDALRAVARDLRVELHLVTDPTTHRWFGRVGTLTTARLAGELSVPTVIHKWSAQTLAEVASTCDLGVIPLDLHDPLAAGKPENKLTLMWRLGLPVLASATPAYSRVMAAAGLDLTCATSDSWEAGLRRLADNPDERAHAAARGTAYIATHHTPERLLAKWDQVVHDALARGSVPRTVGG